MTLKVIQSQCLRFYLTLSLLGPLCILSTLSVLATPVNVCELFYTEKILSKNMKYSELI